MDGEEGVRMAREEQPDMILMDVSIPRIDGWEVTRILKSEETTCAIPIVALTALGPREAREKAIDPVTSTRPAASEIRGGNRSAAHQALTR